jgi:hypothetical protein
MLIVTQRPSEKCGEKSVHNHFHGGESESYSSGVQCCSDLGKAKRLESDNQIPCGEIENELVN